MCSHLHSKIKSELGDSSIESETCRQKNLHSAMFFERNISGHNFYHQRRSLGLIDIQTLDFQEFAQGHFYLG